jgi:two-component system sensor histidine kinase AlgZ
MEGVHWWLAYAEGRNYVWWTQVQRSAFLYLDWEMMTYWAIVGLSHALLFYRESRARELRAAQLETRLVAAQLTTLQQQLHPHFLFNTLHAISSLMHKDVNAADRVLIQLSDLLRITLEHSGRQDITLDAELGALSKYLAIEQTRFADRLVVRFEIQPETLDCLVPSLLLQPLVENAIKHGVEPSPEGARLRIRTERRGDVVVIEVVNSLPPLRWADEPLPRGHGIALANVRDRLRLLHDMQMQFSAGMDQKNYRVRIAIPAES